MIDLYQNQTSIADAKSISIIEDELKRRGIPCDRDTYDPGDALDYPTLPLETLIDIHKSLPRMSVNMVVRWSPDVLIDKPEWGFIENEKSVKEFEMLLDMPAFCRMDDPDGETDDGWGYRIRQLPPLAPEVLKLFPNARVGTWSDFGPSFQYNVVMGLSREEWAEFQLRYL